MALMVTPLLFKNHLKELSELVTFYLDELGVNYTYTINNTGFYIEFPRYASPTNCLGSRYAIDFTPLKGSWYIPKHRKYESGITVIGKIGGIRDHCGCGCNECFTADLILNYYDKSFFEDFNKALKKFGVIDE